MRALPFRRSFDLVVLLSAFGYFDADGEDVAFLRGVHGVLERGGRLLMRNPNATRIRDNFQPQDVQERDGRTIEIHRRLDAEGRWMDEDLVIRDDTVVDEYQRRQLIYSAEELEALLDASGFDRVSHYANPACEFFDGASSSSVITVGWTA